MSYLRIEERELETGAEFSPGRMGEGERELRSRAPERLGPIGTLVAVAVNLALGLAIIALKLVVVH